MRVVRPRVYLRILVQLPTERSFRQHASKRDLKRSDRIPFDKFAEGKTLEPAREAGVMVIHLVLPFAAAHHDFIGVDNDDKVAGFLRGLVGRLIFAPEHRSSLCRDTTEALALGVDHVPGALGVLGLGRDKNSLHDVCTFTFGFLGR